MYKQIQIKRGVRQGNPHNSKLFFSVSRVYVQTPKLGRARKKYKQSTIEYPTEDVTTDCNR